MPGVPFNTWESRNREDIGHIYDKFLSHMCSYDNFAYYCYKHSIGTGNYNNKHRWCFKKQEMFVSNLKTAIMQIR